MLKRRKTTVQEFSKRIAELVGEKGDNISNSDLQMFYRMIFNKAGAVLTTKLSDTYVWNDDDDNKVKIQWIEKILSELEELSSCSIKEVTPAEVEAIVAECTNIPIGKIQAREKRQALGNREQTSGKGQRTG